MKNSLARAEIGCKYSVEYTRQIRDAAGKVIWQSAPKKNLITDWGLDNLSGNSMVNLFTVGVVGTSAQVIRRDSGATTLTLSGGVITASLGFFLSTDVGKLIKFNDVPGTEVYITSYTSSTIVGTTNPASVAAVSGTIWYVDLVAPAGESKRTQTYNQDPGDNGSTFSVDTWTHKRTYLFSAEVGTVTYRSVGWSYSTTPGINCFGVDQIPGAGDTLIASQQYAIIVNVTQKFSPTTPTAVSDVGSGGYDTAGTISMENTQCCGIVLSTGASSVGPANLYGEPFGAGGNYYSLKAMTANWTQAGISGGGGDLTGDGMAPAAAYGASYVAGSFTRTITAAFATTDGNGTHYGFGLRGGGSNQRGITLKFTTPQTKASTHTLTVVWRWTWNRLLTN